MRALQWQQLKLDATRGDTIIELVAVRRWRKAQALLRLQPALQFISIEVADAKVAEQSTLHQLVETAQCFGQRMPARPMQQIQVKVIAAHALDGRFAGAHSAAAR